MKSQTGTQEKLGDGKVYDAIVVGSGYGGSIAAYRMSKAGIKVCVVEKGRQWRAEDFPTNSFKMLSTVRMENQNFGISFGPENALFQVYEQKDSVAVVACGLGGGSLINAGVMLRTPVRTRRHLKWPKEWEKDWDICEASAAAMLKIQTAPVKFPVTKVLGEIVDGGAEGSLDDSVPLSVNFDVEEPVSRSLNQPTGSCLACGNCLAGCPYNAKNSTDKNYLLSAIQAGCTVKTECQVRYVLENPNFNSQEDTSGKKKRWLVYLNEIDYITSDFIVLSAGVFGTSEILFRSQMRGLRLSEHLGCGFSCNGNSVAYLVGSPAPLNGYGLKRKDLTKIPFEERPGPSISSYYTSSLGFSVQNAVLPTAYPHLLLKGMATYGWPTGYWLLHAVMEKLRWLIGYRSTQAISFNAIGYDEGDGRIKLEKDTDKISFHAPHDPLLPQKVHAFQKLTKRLGGILFMSRYRSSSVHLLGGCNAASDSSGGVCNHKGQVFDMKQPTSVHPGLYVCDASLIPCAVGINPALTIATAAEHVSRHLVQDILEYKSKIGMKGEASVADQSLYPASDEDCNDDGSIVLIKETMRGYIGGMPCSAHLHMKVNPQYQKGFDEFNWFARGSHPQLKGKVGGYIVLKAVEKEKLQVIEGTVDMCVVNNRTPYTQCMHYHLLLAGSSGSRYILEGKKTMSPYLFGLYAPRETTTLEVSFRKVTTDNSRDAAVNFGGVLSISLVALLKSFISLRGNGKGRFIRLLLQSLVSTYILQIPRQGLKDFIQFHGHHKPYPSSSLHKIETGDGQVVSCRQWKCNSHPLKLNKERELNPVLLLNGHSGESYYLPTEPYDLVRTLLEEGHDTWLLQPRLHPTNLANAFTIDDIGKYDIPAAITKILEVHGAETKIHVIAHCVGGLAIHIAIMGGHVSATNIASLSCTNSSMFFKLTTLAKIKMWLPLVPISMAVLGKSKVVPLLETLEESIRQRLLKFIARCIPRYERCSCKECEIFSGIFGNAFWHENVTPSLHHWLNKENITVLPMAAFSHIRKICKSGFIVDSNGTNSYLIHPQRMAVSTLYMSGGRSLLVTQETSFLAYRYMKLHQPGYRHERVVVEGFGHSDLLIGEKSHEKVFPHIVSHIRACEEEGNQAVKSDRTNNKTKEVLYWGSDRLYEDPSRNGCWFSPSNVLLLLLLFIVLLVSFSL